VEAVKTAVTDSPVLRYYDIHEEITIECDSSEVGLGATLLQDGQPVSFASRARDVLFWPGMAKVIHAYISKCAICNEFWPQQQKEPLIPRNTPKLPWADVAVDLFCFDSDNYVVAVDYFSDFFVLEQLQDTTTTSVVKMLKRSFATHGIPESVRTNNGLQLVSEEFRVLAREWKFHHVTSSSYYARSNGKAESAVKIAKTLLQKAKRDGRDIWLCLLEWRNVPTQGLDSSPCQRLMSKRTRSLLPVSTFSLKPKVIDSCVMEKKYKCMKRFYDRTSKQLRELIPGELIQMYHPGNKRWLLGKCIKRVAPRSYVAEVNGVRYRRNRSFLRTTCEESPMYDSYVWDLSVPNMPAPCATSSVENSQAGLRQTRTRVIKTPQHLRLRDVTFVDKGDVDGRLPLNFVN